jgi:hypothetical protein
MGLQSRPHVTRKERAWRPVLLREIGYQKLLESKIRRFAGVCDNVGA